MRLPHLLAVTLTLLFTTLAACDAPPPLPDRPAPTAAPIRCRPRCGAPVEQAPDAGGERPVVRGSPPDAEAPLVAFTDAGDLAIIDAASGAILGSAPGGGLHGPRDITLDPWGDRVVVFESDEDETGGEITTYPLHAPQIGPRAHLAWVDGRVRLAAAPLGIVVFEESYGTRWKMFWRDGSPTTSVAAPRPASAWIDSSSGGAAVQALTYGDGAAPPALDLRRMELQPGSLEAPAVIALAASFGSLPPTARMVRAPALGGDLLVDRGSSGMTLVLVSSLGAVMGSTSVDILGPSSRVEAATTLEGGRVVVVLTSNEPRLVAVRLGDGFEVIGAAALDLGAPVRVEDLFFSRDLRAIAPGRVLAATAAGVLAIDVTEGDLGVTLTLDPFFNGSGLRGPLDDPTPPS
jgi:hypothetical protein